MTRKIVVGMSVSLDGYMEGPDHDLSWHRVDDELHRHFNDYLGAMSAFLDGRRSWELMSGYWPTADQEPDAAEPEREFSRIWRDMPKIVYSRTLREAGWNATISREVDADEVRALKEQPGGDMALGGADLAHSFQELGLIDEYRLYVMPVALGAGTPMFQAPVTLSLLETRTFGNGVVLLRYGTGA